MTRDQALSKIKKCLALGRSTNPHEAAAAMRQAQKLMAAHSITDREMSVIDVHEVPIKACSTAINAWESQLASMVANAFGCDVFARKSGGYTAHFVFVRQLHYVFIGIDAAATVACYAFETLVRQCAKDRLVHIRQQSKRCKPITKTARGDEFAYGWVAAVSALIERFANPEANEALLQAYKDEKYPGMKNINPRDTTTGRKLGNGHGQAGYQAGKDAQLNRGVTGGSDQGLLL